MTGIVTDVDGLCRCNEGDDSYVTGRLAAIVKGHS